MFRFIALTMLAGWPLFAVPPHKLPFSSTQIDLERVFDLKGELRDQVEILFQEGIRVVAIKSDGTGIDLSSSEEPLTAKELKLLSEPILREAKESGREAFGGRLELVGMALPPYERIELEIERPREAESLILLRSPDAGALRHEYMHILIDLAAKLPMGNDQGKTISHLDFLSLKQRQNESTYSKLEAIAKSTPNSANIRRHLEAAIDFDISKYAATRHATIGEFDVISVELEYAQLLGLSEDDIRGRVIYFLENIARLYSLEQTIFKLGPYKDVGFDQLTADDGKAIKTRLDELRKTIDSAHELADKADTFISQSKYAPYFPDGFKPK